MAQSTVRRVSRASKSEHVGMAMYEVTVARTQRLTPHLVRITLASEELREFRDDGPDQRFKLLLPRPGQQRPVLPDRENWYDSWQGMPVNVRPVLRTYTVRSARPDRGEIDVDFVLHDLAGPASSWAAAATPGDQVAVYGAWAEYAAPPAADRQLVAGDHTALPAISAICERMTSDVLADVLIEVAGPSEHLDMATPPGVSIRWLDAEPGHPGTALHAAITALPAEAAFGYAWVAAERDTVGRIRRHLIADRGLAPQQIMFMGYWRADGAIDDD